MRHLYYTLQTLLRGHGGTAEKIISLTLGLAMGVLLFAQIAYELSFDRFYPNPDTLVMLRMRNVTKGVPTAEYNYGTYRPAAADLSEAFPELVESACLTSNFWARLLQGRQEAGRHPDPLCRHGLLRHHRPDPAEG